VIIKWKQPYLVFILIGFDSTFNIGRYAWKTGKLYCNHKFSIASDRLVSFSPWFVILKFLNLVRLIFLGNKILKNYELYSSTPASVEPSFEEEIIINLSCITLSLLVNFYILTQLIRWLQITEKIRLEVYNSRQ